ncbi:precorrin-6A/cobalt-precorrin-6A reductase [Marinomonas aquiplantarum]|uniref:Precorrin-6A/cobalt-precorrin-6A reductase n=1 Tax=Marinomonas aquiplantarum TaxID=491951 RepID=A0A366CZN8_9GAMM|nr:precorrin-6A/cobalt-precorrin-6A reductase [Marinomonas aquiplantarum]RBO83290.1 precorrin-6A/cobalt-precorrin-6A reductase [Marinomonas aquiplantarum]
MKRILLLGGTADARRLADALHQSGIQVIYSLAGLVRIPQVDCELLVGGFSQFGGLVNYLQSQAEQGKAIDAIVDVTHPYAQTMSSKAVLAAQQVGIPCWRFHRPAWQQETGDDWHFYQSEEDLLSAFANYQRPLLSAGQMTQEWLQTLAAHPQMDNIIWRTAVTAKFPLPDKVVWLKAIGPFAYEDELALLTEHKIDVIVSKNSGGKATYAKLVAARKLNLPVYLQARPELSPADKEFDDLAVCLQACQQAWAN